MSKIAIAKFFDGEAPDPVEEARASLASSPGPTQSSHRETLLSSSPRFRGQIRGSQRSPAPRIVPQPVNQNTYKAPFILSLLLTPFNVLYRLLSGSLRLFSYLFPFLPRIARSTFGRVSQERSRQSSADGRSLNPRDTAERFAREFEDEYGPHSLQFSRSGYAQAYDLAKKDLKFLLVILISPEHVDNSNFVRNTLLSREVVDYVNDPQHNIVLWAGSVQNSEAYQVSSALNCTKFPFAAIIAYTPQDSSASMSTIARISGLVPSTVFVSRLQAAIDQHSATLQQARAARNQQEATRSLREEQNSAYERSLAQDRERARQRREAEEGKLRAEREEMLRKEATQLNAHNVEQWRKWRAQSIPKEPGLDVKEVTRVSMRLTSGERIVRKFAADSVIEELYAFVECYDILQSNEDPSPAEKPDNYQHSYGFRLLSPMPRSVLDVEDSETVGSRIGRSGNLLVELIDDEEGDA